MRVGDLNDEPRAVRSLPMEWHYGPRGDGARERRRLASLVLLALGIVLLALLALRLYGMLHLP